MKRKLFIKLLALALCLVCAVCCMFACGKIDDAKNPPNGDNVQTPPDGDDPDNPDDDPPDVPQITAPTVTPASARADANNCADGLEFTVNYGGGSFISLTESGIPLPSTAYRRRVSKLTLNGDYIATLSSGTHTFVLAAEGGECSFTVDVTKEGITFTDPVRMKSYDGNAVSFKVDFGTGALTKVTVNGAELAPAHYSYADGKITLGKPFLDTLPNGLYEFVFFDQKGGYADCAVTVGFEPKETFFVNYDGFKTPSGYGAGLSVKEVDEGLIGKGGHVSSPSAGVLFQLDAGEYGFTSGKKYSLTAYFNFERTQAGTSSVLDLLVPVRFFTATPNVNADLGYIRYNETDGYYFTSDSASTFSQFTKAGEWYRLYIEFTYKSEWKVFDMAVWMVCNLTVDGVKITPQCGKMAVAETDSVRVPLNAESDVSIAFGSERLLGLTLNGAALSENEYSFENGTLALKASALSPLSAGEHVLTVFSANGIQTVTLNVNNYSFEVTADSFRYTLNNKDMDFAVKCDGFSLSDATISDSKGELKSGDYSVSGNTLTLKAAYLEKISGKEDVAITFEENADVTFTVESNKLMFIDFDNNDINKGFGIECDTQKVEGKSGNGMQLTVTKTATMLALGGPFYPVTFEAGKTYRMEFDIKLVSVTTETNFVIAGNSLYMPVTFGSGADAVYIRVTKTESGYTVQNEGQQVGSNTSVSAPDENGFYHIAFDITPNENCTKLDFNLWMPSVIVVDNLTLTQL